MNLPAAIPAFSPALLSASEDLPWLPSSTPGKSYKMLRFLPDGGFVELLRMQPGTVMPLHRHQGAVHAFNLSGERTLCTGEIVRAGDYVYEPAGNVDWWKATGDEPMICLVIVFGAVEYLHADGSVKKTISSAMLRQEYEQYCASQGLPIRHLQDA